MGLEEDIKQKKFKTEHEKAAINIFYTNSWLRASNTAFLKGYKLTMEQYNVLRILRGSFPNPLMLSEITCRMLDKSSNATRLVEKLRIKELVSRHVCEKSRRQVDISITEKGLALLTKIDNENKEWSSILANLTENEATELNRLLDKLRK